MRENKLLDLKNDIVFQKIFGSQKNKEITSHLLSIILNRKIENINLDVNKELMGDTKNYKKGVLDVRATFNDGEDVDIEIQMNKFDKIGDRLMFYWSRMYFQKMERGDNYDKLKRSIIILIANFIVPEIKEIPEYKIKYTATAENYPKYVLTDKFEVYILELPKLKEVDIEKEELALWLRFISNANDMEVKEKMDKKENKYLKQAMEELQHLSNDPGFERIVESREKFLRDQAQREKDSKKRGEEQGKKIGEKIGKKLGKEEIAKKMLEKGMSIDEIIELTELTKKEIENLK